MTKTSKISSIKKKCENLSPMPHLKFMKKRNLAKRLIEIEIHYLIQF